MVHTLKLDIEFWDHLRDKPRKMTSADWNKPSLEILLNVYRDHPILYDMRHPKYYAKVERQKALNTIIEMLDDHRPGTTTSDILKKIQTMRTQFGQEFSKVRKAQSKGNKYVPSVWWYDYLAFLQKHIKPRTCNIRDEITDHSQETEDGYMSSNQTTEDYESYTAEEQYDDNESEIVYEIQGSPTNGLKTEHGSETKYIRRRDYANLPVTGNEEVVYEITNGNTVVPKRKLDLLRSPIAAEPETKQQRTDTVVSTSSPKGAASGIVVQEITVEPDRCKSFGLFVASQIATVKDDMLFYSTQMEVLNVINKAQLKQLQMDKDAASKT